MPLLRTRGKHYATERLWKLMQFCRLLQCAALSGNPLRDSYGFSWNSHRFLFTFPQFISDHAYDEYPDNGHACGTKAHGCANGCVVNPHPHPRRNRGHGGDVSRDCDYGDG